MRVTSVADLAAALAAGPDPQGSAVGLARWIDAVGGAEAAGRVLAVPGAGEIARSLLSQSPWLARILTRDPDWLAALAGDRFLHTEKPAAELAREAEACAAGVSPGDFDRALRRFRDRELLRLGARELAAGLPVDPGAPATAVVQEEVWRELSYLADACLDAAVRFHDRLLAREVGEPHAAPGADEVAADGRPRLAVLGMGKLGGEELNFSSDVDLVYVYSTDQGAAGALSLHEYFAKLAERVTRSIAQVTEDGFVFRVDLRLRPEGSRGAIANSFAAAERYYETWGRTWERQAWIKARPVAGDLELGGRVLAMLAPFVYRRSLSPDQVADTIESVGTLLEKTRAELRRSVDPDPDVKLGRGGIREVEFFVQTLQLLYGGKQPALRRRGTLPALAQLQWRGLVTDRDRRALERAYRTLRAVEHRLQLEHGRQTQRLPERPEDRALLARRLGVPDAATLDAFLGAVRSPVAALFDGLGAWQEEEGEGRVLLARDLSPAESAADTLCDPYSQEADVRAALATLAFADPASAAEEIERLRAGAKSLLLGSPEGTRGRTARRLLVDLGGCADPDGALRHLVDLATRRGIADEIARLCERRSASRLLTSVLGASDVLAAILIERPALLAELLEPGAPPAPLGRGEVEREAAARVAEAGDDREQMMTSLVRLKQEQILRVGLGDVGGTLGVTEVSAALGDVAEVLLAEVLARVAAQVAGRLGMPQDAAGRPARLSLVGMGSLGARELGYASDLDLVLVYSSDGIARGAVTGGELTSGEVFARIAQRLVGALALPTVAGRLYDVDLRLRPSGNQGTLVVSLAAFRAYHEREARLWERQALTRARVVAGDSQLGAEVDAAIQEFAFLRPCGDASTVAAEIAAMRRRLEQERARETAARWDIKIGAGGTADVEFAAQLLQIVHGRELPELRARSTLPVIEAAAAAGLLTADERAAFAEGYTFERRLLQRLRITGSSSSTLDASDASLAVLAHRLGDTGPGAAGRLRAAYRHHTTRVRDAFDALVRRAGSTRRGTLVNGGRPADA